MADTHANRPHTDEGRARRRSSTEQEPVFAEASTPQALANALLWTVPWLYALTMTRLVADQLTLMRRRILSMDRFRAFPPAGYTPDSIADAVEPDPLRRRAVALGLLAPLLENWGLGMTLARLLQCFDVERILDRPDAAAILSALVDEDDPTPAHPDLDLIAVRARILSNLQALRESVRAATQVHPREVVIDADAGSDRRCNVLQPGTFPKTASGRAGCRACLSMRTETDPLQMQPRPFYEREPTHSTIRWDPLFDRICELKKNGPLVGDPGWDDAPAYSKKSKKSGQEKWDWRLMTALRRCEKNFDDFERTVLHHDIGGTTAAMLHQISSQSLAQIIVKLAPALRPATDFQTKTATVDPAFNLNTVFGSYIVPGPSRQFNHLTFSEQRSLFLQLYGPISDFIPDLESLAEKTAAGKSSEQPLGPTLLATKRASRSAETAAKERSALARAAQLSRDTARAHVGLPALGLIARNEIMRSIRESATATFLKVSEADSNPDAVASVVGAARGILLRCTIDSWATLGAELKRQAEADLLGVLLRAVANVEARHGWNAAIDEGWSRAISNAIDVSMSDGWEPSQTSLSTKNEDGSAGIGTNEAYISRLSHSLQARLEVVENEAGLFGGTLEDPGLQLNLSVAWLKLSTESRNSTMATSRLEKAEQYATRTLELLAFEGTSSKPVSATSSSTETTAMKQQGGALGFPASYINAAPVIDDTTGPADVLDVVAFWIGGGRHTALAFDDFDAGVYSAGHSFASTRIARDIQRAEQRERRQNRRALLQVDGVTDNEDEDPDGDDAVELEINWWDAEADDEPAPGSFALRPGADKSEDDARERVRTSRRAIRTARTEVLANLALLLGKQLGTGTAHDENGSAHGNVEGAVSARLHESLLAPSRMRSVEARRALVWKALVRRAMARAAIVRHLAADRSSSQKEGANGTVPEKEQTSTSNCTVAAETGIATERNVKMPAKNGQDHPDESEDGADARGPREGQQSEDTTSKGSMKTTTSRGTEDVAFIDAMKRRADLARKDLEAALSLDPSSAIPRKELDGLEALLASVHLTA